MTLQSTAQYRRDDRRRRLLADECLGGGPQTTCSLGPNGSLRERKSENYGDAAFLDDQPRLIDLVPHRLVVVGLFWLLGMAAVAGLEGLYLWSAAWLPGGERFAAFDLAADRSLASCSWSFTLLAASLAAVLVYTVRRHKTDDYQGHYRIWLWAALCWFLLSVDAAAGLHHGLQQVMVYLTGTRLLGDGWIWWLIPYLFLLGAVGSRLLIDVWYCRLSSAALALAAACGGLALAVRAGWVLADAGAERVMLGAGAQMSAALFLLLAMVLHARHVILDAKGLLPRREPKTVRQSSGASLAEEDDAEIDNEDAAAGGGWLKVDSPHGTPQPVLRRSPASAPAAASAVPSAAPAVSAGAAATNPTSLPGTTSVTRTLTKGERKALRQRLEQERLKREAKQQSGWRK